jgi:hypothetical protein
MRVARESAPRCRTIKDGSAGRVAEHREHSICTIQRRKRFWEVRDPAGELVCLTVYKRGAEEVRRRLLNGSLVNHGRAAG